MREHNERAAGTFEHRMERFEHRMHRHHRRGRVWTGLFLLLLGGLLLAREAGVAFPAWFFTWPMLLIGIGFFIGFKHGFRRGGWFVLVLIGTIFLYDKMDPDVNLRPYLWPVLFITMGLCFILRPRRRYWKSEAGWSHDTATHHQTGASDNSAPADRTDFIETTAIFGGIKKNVLSKNFKGGDIVNFMGGSEINLLQADFSGRVKIDVTNFMGGAKLIVPPDWDVQSEVVTIFGGIDDKRQVQAQNLQPDKVLVLDGTCFFGGIEIKSF